MVEIVAVPVIQQPIPPPVGEKRMVFDGLSWLEFLQVRGPISRSRNIRLTYDRGKLEITMPLELHEFSAELIGLFVRILVRETGLKIKEMGSTTLEKEALNRSAEPDKAYYIKNQPLVAGRTVDLAYDPPPDLVIEVDITHTDIDKLSLYADMGIPEFWRYDGRVWRIYQLAENAYEEVEVSPTFPKVAKNKLYEFLTVARQDEIEAEQQLRAWLRERAIQSN